MRGLQKQLRRYSAGLTVVVRRRTKVALALACAGALAAYVAAPRIVEHRLRARLADRGFPEARLEVASLGWRHLQLRNVHLQDGIELGALDLHPGVSLLWRDLDEVSIANARVSTAALARIQPVSTRKARRTVPFRRARVKDSVLDIDGTEASVTGTAARKGTSLEITVSVRDPSKDGWSAEARGRIVWDDGAMLENAHVDVTVPRQRVGSATVTSGLLEADLSGDLSKRELRGKGTARIDRVELGALDISAVTIPFTFDHRGVRVAKARAETAGGELTVDPFVLRGSSFDLVVRAHGLRLGSLLAPTKRVTGTGVLDGHLAMRVEDGGLWLERGELRARAGGTIQIADAGWRKRIGAAQSPFAVQANVVNALTDFQYRTLELQLAPPGAGKELELATRGRGRRNRQELDIAIAVRGVRDVVARRIGAVSE